MYGTRLGCHMTNLTDWDFINVRDFEYLNNLFDSIKPTFAESTNSHYKSVFVEKCYKTGYSWDSGKLVREIEYLGEQLRKGLGMEVAELNEIQSKFYKAAQYNTPRMNKMLTEEELVQLRRTNK
jgi:hypothetical protein